MPNSTRKCAHCKKRFRPQQEFPGPVAWCSPECGKALALKRLPKQRERQRRQFKRENRKAKERLITRAQWVDKAQKEVNRLVVLEDGPKGCISCDSREVTDAGHFFHRGSKYRTSPLTLDRRNLAGQCPQCNRFSGGGNQYNYMQGYIARYGRQAFEELEEFKRAVDRGEVSELTIDDCKRIIKETKAKIKAMRGQRAA